MHVHLRVGDSPAEPAFESVHAQPLGGRRYAIEFSPGLAYGIAAGDEIELADDGTYEVVTRGGNVAVRVLSEESLAPYEAALTSKVKVLLGGRLDGSIGRGSVYTVPVQTGFLSIESVFNEFSATNPKAVWEYGNVYSEDGIALLWWEVRPNPSLERTSTGLALGPRTGQCHHPSRGPSTNPAVSAQLKR